MISSPNKNISQYLAAPLFLLGSLVLSPITLAQEKPRSLVPSLNQEKLPDQTQVQAPTPFGPPSNEGLSKQVTPANEEGLSGSFVVEKLDALNPSSVGTIGELDGSLGADMWRGTSPRLAAALLSKIGFGTSSPQMADLYRRLLLTGAVLSGTTATSDEILDIRFQKLREFGLAQDMSDLVGRLPKNAVFGEHEKMLVELDLLLNRDSDACQKLERREDTNGQDIFWAKIDVYCRLLAEDYDRAELGAALLEEQGDTDPLYFALFAKLAGDTSPISTESAILRPLHLAMIRRAKVALDANLMEKLTPETFGMLTLSPKMLDEAGADVVFYAASHNSLDLDILRNAFVGAAKVDVENINELALHEKYATLLAGAVAATEDFQKATLLEELLVLATENSHFQTISKLSLQEIENLKPANYGPVMNFTAVKALLLHGQRGKASFWERIIRRAASQGTPAERLAKRSDVARLDAYMLISGASAIARWNSASFNAWKKATERDPDQGMKTELLLSFLEVFDYPVAEADWQELLFMNIPLTAAKSSHALDTNLIAAASAGRDGEVVALALQTLGSEGPAGSTTTTLVAVTSALKAVGLTQEARNLAIEVMIAKGF